jgi:hypothetical protein
MKRSVLVALALAIAGAPTFSIAKDRSVRASEGKPDPACRRVSYRFSICGSTNFKNKIVVGGAVRFNKVDPSGRLKTAGAKR